MCFTLEWDPLYLLDMAVRGEHDVLTPMSALGTASHECLGKSEEPRFGFLSHYNFSLALHFFFHLISPSDFVSPALLTPFTMLYISLSSISYSLFCNYYRKLFR